MAVLGSSELVVIVIVEGEADELGVIEVVRVVVGIAEEVVVAATGASWGS